MQHCGGLQCSGEILWVKDGGYHENIGRDSVLFGDTIMTANLQYNRDTIISIEGIITTVVVTQ